MWQRDLFDASKDLNVAHLQRSKSAPTDKRSRAPAHDPVVTGWTLTNHICRHCGGGRILERQDARDPDAREFICSNCEATHHGRDPEAMCFCGMRVKRFGPRGGEIDPGVRCHRNPKPTPDFPSTVVASEKPKEPVN